MYVSLAALVLTFVLSATWCAERLVRATNPAACLLALPTLLGSWIGLITLRLPPPAELALAAFGLADLAVLALSVLGVLRLLGGFEVLPPDEDDGGGDDEPPEPNQPAPRTPHGRRPSRPVHRHPRRPRPRPAAGRRGVNA